MNLAAQYYDALNPARYRVFGRRLRPFCVGHELTLQRIGSPFASTAPKDSKAGVADLLVAVAICSRTFERGVKWRKSKRAQRWLERKAKRLSHPSLEASNLELMLTFIAYRNEAWDQPRFNPTSRKKAPESGIPLVLTLQMTLMLNYGKTLSQALNTPMSEALWEHIAYMEREGLVTVPPPLNEQQKDLLENHGPEIVAWAEQLERDRKSRRK